MTFVDYLVGVYSDHSGVRVSEALSGAQNVNFTWTFRQGKWGTRRLDRMRFASFDEHDPGSEGAVTFQGFFSQDATTLAATVGISCAPPALSSLQGASAAPTLRDGLGIHAREMHAQLFRRG